MKLVLLSILTAALLILPLYPATAANITFMEFHQLIFQFNEDAAPSEPGTIGTLMVAYDKDFEMGYLNLSARLNEFSPEPVWLVKNMPLFSMEFGPPQAETDYALQLSQLGVEYGMLVHDIEYVWEVMPMPMSDDEGHFWASITPMMEMQPVMLRVVNATGLIYDKPWDDPHSWPNPDDLWSEPFRSELPPWEYWSMIGCDMPNVPLDSGTNADDDGGCVPASTANSMTWLKNKHTQINFPGTLRETYDELSHLMNRKGGKGVSTKEQARAKLDFIEAHNLPIKVKIQNYCSNGNISSSSGHSQAADTDGGPLGTWPTRDWIFSETQDQEDVEISYGYYYKKADGTWGCDGGHSVVLSGAGTIAGAPYLSYKDDEDQETSAGTAEHHRWLTTAPNGAVEMRGEGGRWKHSTGDTTTVFEHHAFIDGVVSESYDEHHVSIPTTETFTNYCKEFVRVIPPGKSLDITFPSSSFWCRNVTVYVRDRSDKPAKDVKDREWNNNEDKTRRITNSDTVKTMTVVVHCDDRQPAIPGYNPWTVDLAIVASTKASTPGNPNEYGGFSMGWSDSSGAEFGDVIGASITIDGSAGADLSTMPRQLGVTDGCQELILTRPIPIWNVYWEELNLIVDVAELTQPGTLFVDCPSTGTLEPITITSVGRHEIFLGHMPMAPNFTISLTPGNGLNMVLDCVGIPSMFNPASGVQDESSIPTRPIIRSIHPNPFNPMTAIRFALPKTTDVELVVYDLQGRRVATVFEGILEAGEHSKIWKGTNDQGKPAAAGTYLVQMRAAGTTITSKATLVK